MSNNQSYPKLSELIMSGQFDEMAWILIKMYDLGFDADAPDDTFDRLIEQGDVSLATYEAMCEIARAAKNGDFRVTAMSTQRHNMIRIAKVDVVAYVKDALDLASKGFEVKTFYSEDMTHVAIFGYKFAELVM